MASSKKDLSMPKYCRRVLCFDTETTGLMPKHKPGTPFPEDAAYPYITQLSWIVYNVVSGEVEEVVDEYIQIPATVEISPESTKVSGITREIVDLKGKPLAPLLVRFYAAYMRCDSIVAHNMNFDKEIIRQEMRRNRCILYGIVRDRSRVNTMLGIGTKRFNQVYDIELFCTMTNTVELCNIEWTPRPNTTENITKNACDSPEEVNIDAIKEVHPTKSTRKKWPTLTELYTKLFATSPPSDLHNSIIDVLVCLRCFLNVRNAVEMQEDVFHSLVGKYSRTDVTNNL